MTTRRFPPPWSVEDSRSEYVVEGDFLRDCDGSVTVISGELSHSAGGRTSHEPRSTHRRQGCGPLQPHRLPAAHHLSVLSCSSWRALPHQLRQPHLANSPNARCPPHGPARRRPVRRSLVASRSFTVPSVTAFFDSNRYSGVWGQRMEKSHAVRRLRIGDRLRIGALCCCRIHRRIRDWLSA